MTLEQIERSLDRLRSRLYRTVNAINKLEKAHKRLKRKMAPDQEPVAIVAGPATSETAIAIADDLAIPPMLRRSNEKDEAAIAEILAQQEAEKKCKTAARIGKMKAAKAGDTKRMPLTGRAALEAIRG